MAGKSNEEIYSEAEKALAIELTEDEIFSEALGKEQDDNDGDRSLEEMDDDDIPGETEDDEETDELEATSDDDDDVGDEEPEGETQDERVTKSAMVPSSRVREETALRQAAEAEARAAKAERDSLNARLAALERGVSRTETPPQQPVKPDLFADPEGYERHLIAQANRAAETRFLNANLADAAETHGEKFNAAYQALLQLNPQDPVSQATVQRMIASPNPARAIMKWHSEQQILSRAGPDPDAYINQLVEERLQERLGNMRGEAQRGDGGRPRTQVRIPRSLNEAGGRGGSPRTRDPDATDNSDASVFAYATRR